MIESILSCEVYMSKYKKPSKELFREMTKRYRVSAKDVVVIGDFHFTDVFFAKSNHAMSVLVNPLGREGKLLLTFARIIENVVLCILKFFR